MRPEHLLYPKKVLDRNIRGRIEDTGQQGSLTDTYMNLTISNLPPALPTQYLTYFTRVFPSSVNEPA